MEDQRLFFLAWRRSDTEVDRAALADAAALMHLADGDPVVRAVWPSQKPMPRCRWIEDKVGVFSQDELDVLGDIARASAEGEGWYASPELGHEHGGLLTDAMLIYFALGQAGRPSALPYGNY